MSIFKRKPKGKFSYYYSVNGSLKSLRANSMQEAVDKIVKNHLWSYASRGVNFISSNDPDAPQWECLMYQNSFYDSQMTLKPID
jgi:hypothetical protein